MARINIDALKGHRQATAFDIECIDNLLFNLDEIVNTLNERMKPHAQD